MFDGTDPFFGAWVGAVQVDEALELSARFSNVCVVCPIIFMLSSGCRLYELFLVAVLIGSFLLGVPKF